MSQRILYPEWRKSNETTRYPFSTAATLTGTDGTVLLEGTFLDAALYPIGSLAGLYLATATVDHQGVTLTIADQHTRRQLASGWLPLVGAPDNVVLTDSYDRPAGILVSESARLGIFQSWGVGVHAFNPIATEFAATCCWPTPEGGVRGLILEDGSLFQGDVWLIGADGVVLSKVDLTLPGSCGRQPRQLTAIRVDVVGDPLFRRRLCTPTDLFTTPRPVKKLRLLGPFGEEFLLSPDVTGNIALTTGSELVPDPVLRITTTAAGITIAAVGSQ